MNDIMFMYDIIHKTIILRMVSYTREILAFLALYVRIMMEVDCIVACHHDSKGRLRRDELDGFLAEISPDFIALAPLLDSRNVKLSITTHSDEAEYTSAKNNSTHIMGEELVRSVLAAAVPTLQDRFEIVAYNPYARHHILLFVMPHMPAKKYHIRQVQSTQPCTVRFRPGFACAPKVRRRFGLDKSDQVLLFDDDAFNTWDIEAGCVAVKVLSPAHSRHRRANPKSSRQISSGHPAQQLAQSSCRLHPPPRPRFLLLLPP
jgi:hypothetical protein